MPETETWYHGSPLRLAILRAGSTITRERDLARVFSHKPPLVARSDDGALQHTGTLPGYLYRVDEPLEPEDATPHPRTTMQPGLEWLTHRDLRLALIGPTEVQEEEFLTEAQVAELRQRFESQRGRGG